MYEGPIRAKNTVNQGLGSGSVSTKTDLLRRLRARLERYGESPV